MIRHIKRELGDAVNGVSSVRVDTAEAETSGPHHQVVSERRRLRSRYLAVKNLIVDEREDIARVDSDKFKSIINEVESLHQQVQKPREQVADAEALLDIASTLVTSVKACNGEGITISDFVTCLLRDFGQQAGPSNSTEDGRGSVAWGDVGVAVSHAFRSSPGCCTMIGPMNNEIKERKVVVHRKRARPTESARPEELDVTATEVRTDTDKNMSTIFDILKKNRRVRLENLVLNRNSFAQTVENLFALSFLAKDGRAEIKVDERGFHFVVPRNAPAANAVASREVVYSHFVFRFDFKDWKLMKDTVRIGEEMMPHRKEVYKSSNCQRDTENEESHEEAAATTPIRKFSRNRGLVLQEQSIVEDSPESNYTQARSAAIRKGKRKAD